jgi:hypothetical protein
MFIVVVMFCLQIFGGARGVCEAMHILVIVSHTFFFWLVYFFMDFAIHNLIVKSIMERLMET